MSTANRLGWTVAGILVAVSGLEAWSGAVVAPPVLIATLACLLVGFAVIVAAWTCREMPRWLSVALLVAAVAAYASRAYLTLLGGPYYGTDEMAFDQYAASLLIQGINPYARSMAPAFQIFNVPTIFYTYTLSGGRVTALSYPAGAFLPYVPGLLLGWHTQEAPVIDAAAWALGGIVAWRLLEPRHRWAAIIAYLASSYYLGLAVGGVIDVLYAPLLLIALYRFDQFSDRTGWRRWIGPTCLGLAASMNQLPWFLVPLLAIAIWHEARGRQRPAASEVARYLGLVALPLIVLDAPFVALGPVRFIRDVLTPLTAHAIPGGQGFIGITLFLHLGGRLEWYSVAGVAALVATWLAAASWYRATKRILVLLVAVVFLFPTRAFASYLTILLPALVVAATSVKGAPSVPRHRRHARRVASLTRVGAVGAACVALLALSADAVLPPPLRIRILHAGSTGQLESIDRLTVSVTNRSDRTIEPHWSVMPTGQQTSFWSVVRGPRVLHPGEHATVVLAAPNVQSMPPLEGAFVLDAFTAKPATISTAPTTRPQTMATVLDPLDIDRAVRIGEPIRFVVQLVNRFDGPIRRAGVEVDLGQVIYAESALEPGTASIDGHPEGASPVSGWTNARGQVTFTVRGVQNPGLPVFFEAWIAKRGEYPFGYSNLVSVRFR